MSLSEDERNRLREIAKDRIEAVLFKRADQSFELTEGLKEKGGAFVTLKRMGELRGCIGQIRAVSPLHQAVKEMAVQAAFHDPRFRPLEKDEWKDVEMEISVLTPMHKIENIEEIEVGKHGIYMERGMQAGLLLPQVATENHWDRETFLEWTCWKAGLPKDAYKSRDTSIYIFSAEVF
jgi:AmmeMemoRadiSam system protein A